MAAAAGQPMEAAALNHVSHRLEPHAQLPRHEPQQQDHHLVDLEMAPVQKEVSQASSRSLPAGMNPKPSSMPLSAFRPPSQRFMAQQPPPVARSSTPHFLDVATTVRKFVQTQRDARKW